MDRHEPLILDTDASDTGIGAMLSQIHDNKNMCVVVYATSRTLTKPNTIIVLKGKSC